MPESPSSSIWDLIENYLDNGVSRPRQKCEVLWPDGTWHAAEVKRTWSESTIEVNGQTRKSYDVEGPDPEYGEGFVFTMQATEDLIRFLEEPKTNA